MDNRPKRKRTRLVGYDYSTPGAYFVTVCVHPRKNMFWKTFNVGADSIRPPSIALTYAGQLVDRAVAQIPQQYPHITVDNYCIMPDHVHMIITIHTDANGRQIAAPTLSTLVGQFKRFVSKQLCVSIWQKSFVERVIRNDNGYQKVWEYIDNNPFKIDSADDPLHFDEL